MSGTDVGLGRDRGTVVLRGWSAVPPPSACGVTVSLVLVALGF